MPLLAELLQSVLVGLTVVKCTVLVGLLRIASSLPFLKERLQEFEEKHNLVPYENFWENYGGKQMLAAVLKIFLGDLNKTAVLGSSAPNCKLVTTDEKPCKLLDFARGTRPLIVNFGSRSWPPFLINFLNNFTNVVRGFQDVADFVIVYICEAHPTDEWRWNVSFFCLFVSSVYIRILWGSFRSGPFQGVKQLWKYCICLRLENNFPKENG